FGCHIPATLSKSGCIISQVPEIILLWALSNISVKVGLRCYGIEALGFGFIVRSRRGIEPSETLVAEDRNKIAGFMEYRSWRDHRTTLYHIVVQSDHRQQGIGRRLIEALGSEAHKQGKTLIQLKCPVDLPANEFYESLGFQRADVLPGKNRELVVWQIAVD
ncbi:MAG: GNAT family N-acetyltransferase, partial [Anaerolineae bacterium]|nr:GNAT family N-acetyltransferase [Anaerolineae bacterium]